MTSLAIAFAAGAVLAFGATLAGLWLGREQYRRALERERETQVAEQPQAVVAWAEPEEPAEVIESPDIDALWPSPKEPE